MVALSVQVSWLAWLSASKKERETYIDLLRFTILGHSQCSAYSAHCCSILLIEVN